MLPTLFGISVLVFCLTQILPGGPVDRYMQKMRFGGNSDTGASGSAELTDELREELNRLYGFDKPIYERYAHWVSGVVKLEFGDSYEYSEPVLDVIRGKFPVNLTFGLFSFFLVYLIINPLRSF